MNEVKLPDNYCSELIDQAVQQIIQFYRTKVIKDPYLQENPFETLLGLGELIDRLTIVNIKLYDLKNEVMQRPNDSSFLAAASLKDVALVEERSRLKNCINEKIICMIVDPKTVPEIKSYGKNFND